MIWLTWRQQRTETLIAALLLGLAAALLVPTGLHMASVYDHAGLAACLGHQTDGCNEALDSFSGRFQSLMNLTGWLNLLPGLIGALLAAPFVMELEHGTFRLAWTQSITRRRWLAAKLALIALAALAASLLFMLLMTWWRSPLASVSGRMTPEGFSFEGIVPLAYGLFAAALVLAIGVVMRRTAPAIGLGLVGFLVVRLFVVENSLRPHYRAALNAIWDASRRGGPDLRKAWILQEGPSDAHGHALGIAGAIPAASGKATGPAPGTFMHALYQPAGRFWLFQAIETGIFTALALALLGFSVWWIRKRIG
jgi:hypothetical protein